MVIYIDLKIILIIFIILASLFIILRKYLNLNNKSKELRKIRKLIELYKIDKSSLSKREIDLLEEMIQYKYVAYEWELKEKLIDRINCNDYGLKYNDEFYSKE
jgi:hypothetical protein